MQIVLVDPSRTVRRIVSYLIQQGGDEVCSLSDGDEALDYIKANPDVRALITCAELPSMSGIELCRQARLQVGNRRPLYILLMSSNDEHNMLVEALDNGADDFICKPPIVEELRARLRTADRVTSMQQELFRYATTDYLTGLLNRRVFFERAGEACERAKTGSIFTVAICDLDHFKQVNDSHGHGVGDTVLRCVAAEAARWEGIVGRLGGEEFGIIVEAAVSDAMEIAETFLRTIRGLKIHADNKVIEVTCSLGLAEWEIGDTVDGLLRRADMALYEAKRKGRNRVVAADTFSISKSHENWQGVSRRLINEAAPVICQKFVVCPTPRGGWLAKLAVREVGPYASGALALQAAVAEAGQFRSVDQPICIVVEDARGEVTAARCICHAFEQSLAARRAQ